MRKSEKVRLEKMKQLRKEANAWDSVLKLQMNSMYGRTGNSRDFARESYKGGEYHENILYDRSQIISTDVMSLYPEVMIKENEILYEDSDSISIKKKDI